MEQPFITWGHKAIDSLLEEMTDKLQAYGNCVRRLSVPLAEGEAVSYLVATEQGPVQVTSYEMLSKVKPAQIPLTEAEVENAQRQLFQLVAEEERHYRQRAQVAQVNEECARIQRDLVRYVAIALLEKTGEEFAQQAIRELEDHPRKTYQTLKLPLKMQAYRNRTLFTVSYTGGEVYITTTPVLNGAAVALCHRASAKLAKHKKKKSRPAGIL